MSDYKVGQIIVVKENFHLNYGCESVNHIKGEYHQITFLGGETYTLVIAALINSEVKLGEKCLFTKEEIENNFIKYEDWLVLHREEQIKSILDE
jgi:hypothetical protein